MTMLWIPLEILMTCLDVFYYLAVPGFQLRYKKWAKLPYVIAYGLFFVLIVTIYNYLTANSISIFFITIGFLAVFYILFVESTWPLKVFWLVFPVALLYGLETSVITLLCYINPNITEYTFSLPNIFRLEFLFYSKFLQLLLLAGFKKYRFKMLNFSSPVLFTLSLSVLGVTSLMTYLILTHLVNTGILFAFSVVIAILLLLFFLSNKDHDKEIVQLKEKCTARIDSIRQKNEQKVAALHEKYGQEIAALKKKHAQETVEQKLKYDLEMRAIQKAPRKIRSLINDRLQIVWGHLSKCKCKIPESKNILEQFRIIDQQISDLFKPEHETTEPIITQDKIIDRILAAKTKLARKHDIVLQIKCAPVLEFPFKSWELGDIISRLLDNAIKAVDEINEPGAEKIVELSLTSEQGLFSLTVANPVQVQEERSTAELTDFESGKNIGLGLKIINVLVHRYQGDLQIDTDDLYFTVMIGAPIRS